MVDAGQVFVELMAAVGMLTSVLIVAAFLSYVVSRWRTIGRLERRVDNIEKIIEGIEAAFEDIEE